MGQSLVTVTELFQSQMETLTKKIQTQHVDLKAMHLAMHSFLIDDYVRQNISRIKLNELETQITCLAQSSISPDILKEVMSLLDIVVQNCKPGCVIDANDMLGELNTLEAKLYQIYLKMQATEGLCVNICQSVIAVSDDECVNKELQKQIDIIKKIQGDNEGNMKEILLQLNHLSQTIPGDATS